MRPPVIKVISGGQTGADRTGLEVARELGIETGGTAPRRYKTEEAYDYSLKDFGLTEHSSPHYPPRTKENVINSDATVLFGDETSPGSRLTIDYCEQHGRPIMVNPANWLQLRVWLKINDVTVLNVAGNRKSKNPDVVEQVRKILTKALQ